MNWICIAVGIMRDPSIVGLSEAVGVSVPTTTGHVVGVLTCMPEGALDGDLSPVSDTTIETWAMWRGKRGKFAAAFRTYLCTAQGVVRSWEKYNGAKLRELQSDRDRKKAARMAVKLARLSGGSPAEETRTSPGRPPLRDETRRDETNNKQRTRAVAHGPKASSDAKFPAFPKPLCDAAYDLWLSEMGATDYGRFRLAFGPLFQRPESERAATMPRDAELLPAIKLYIAAVTGTPEARFATAQKCAESLTRVVEALRDGKDSNERLTLAQWAAGNAPRLPFKGAA